MMKNNLAKRQALTILYQNKLFTLNDYDDLKRIIEGYQFIIIEYQKHTNSEYVSALIKTLGIEKHIEQNDAFIYFKSNLKFLFINAEISERDKCSLLRHELGHICDPNFNDDVTYSKIKKEEFANEFSFYIKNPGIAFRLYLLIIKKWKLLTGMILLCTCILGLFFMIRSHTVQPVTTDIATHKNFEHVYYVTPAGKKYHKRKCVIVKYRSNLTEYTLDEARSLGYKACLVCILDE